MVAADMYCQRPSGVGVDVQFTNPIRQPWTVLVAARPEGADVGAPVIGRVGAQVIDTLPHKPVEPEAAALELNVRVQGGVFHTHAFTPWSSARVPVTGP